VLDQGGVLLRGKIIFGSSQKVLPSGKKKKNGLLPGGEEERH